MSNCDNHDSCINTALKEAQNICDQRDLRFTKIRKTVAKNLQKKLRL